MTCIMKERLKEQLNSTQTEVVETIKDQASKELFKVYKEGKQMVKNNKGQHVAVEKKNGLPK